VAGNLYNDIVYYHNTHLTTGFIGVDWLMPALTETGHPDVAYELATQTTYPSWGYMVKRGATTLWELWQDKTGPSMNSHDHAMFGSVGAWFYQSLAGIQQRRGSAGYRHIVIDPDVVEDLHWASGTIHTIRGTVSSAWVHKPGEIALHVVVPDGADATVMMPQEEQWTQVIVREGNYVVWQDGHYVAGDPGIAAAAPAEGRIRFEIGSGDYSFTAREE
ncbi:MAG TPA: alpha-L-rhamnosidase C-terminal domain-containing protein, partial [Terriglobia bacterium]|nr:alpha-L-rhamnosidase C-terminal domain-containing protein [Terriglobia bacterium]